MALDRLFVSIKVGDNGEYHDGMLIDYFDEAETGVDFTKALTPDCSKKFRFIQVDRRMKPKIVELLQPVGFLKIVDETGIPIPDPVAHRIRGGVLPFKDLTSYVGKSEIELRDQVSACAPLNALLVPETIFKSTLTAKVEGIPDKATITGGSCTIGAGGDAPNYLTWVLFAADVGGLTGNLTATQVAATTETAVCTINVALAGFTFALTSNSPPLGRYNYGHLISHNIANNYGFHITCTSAVSGAQINVSHLNMKRIGNPTILYACIRFSTSGTNIVNTGSNCLADLNGKLVAGFRRDSGSAQTNWFNCVAVNGGGAYSPGFYNVSNSATWKIENCTSFNNKIGSISYYNVAITLSNFACLNNSTFDYGYGNPAGGSPTPGLGNAVASKCASSDATGSEVALQNLVAANQFHSLNLTDGDLFLKLKPDSALRDTGTTPTLAANTYGIRGHSRLRPNFTSIGADEGNAYNRVVAVWK